MLAYSPIAPVEVVWLINLAQRPSFSQAARDSFTRCHTKKEGEDPTRCLTHLQYAEGPE